MPRTLSKWTVAHLVVARILFQDRRENGGGHVGADSVVTERSSETLAVSAPTLSPGFGIIMRLTDCSKAGAEGISEVVEHASGCQPVFLAGGERRKNGGIFHRSVVGHDREDAV